MFIPNFTINFMKTRKISHYKQANRKLAAYFLQVKNSSVTLNLTQLNNYGAFHQSTRH